MLSPYLDTCQISHPVLDGEPYPETYRLLATSMLYLVWERCFTLCHAIGLRLLRDLRLQSHEHSRVPRERYV